MTKRMLINALEKEESRVAITSNGILDEFYVERSSRATLVGNIYKGKVENVHPSLQAAFVNIGLEKNGFLHISEVYSPGERKPPIRKSNRFRPHRERHIQDILKVGQEIIVQVIRDEFGEKGPSLTMEVSLPGRFLVLTPMSNQLGVSKKITDARQRVYLRRALKELSPVHNLGFIIRTASHDTTPADLKGDLSYLTRLWSSALARSANSHPPFLMYHESDMVIRTIRDTFAKDIDEVIVDDATIYSRLLDFFETSLTKYKDRVKYYSGAMPLFHKYGIEGQIEELSHRSVSLPSGGSIVIEQTEAMTTIDVNSGRFVREKTPEETSFKTNLEASRSIMRQLRLRDLGGVIVIDYIDIKLERHRRQIENSMLNDAKRDASQMVILPMSQFCIVQIARQKTRPSLRFISYDTCPTCNGTGMIKNVESIGLEIIRQLKITLERDDISVVELRVNSDVLNFINSKTGNIEKLQLQSNKRIHITSSKDLPVDKVELVGYNEQGEKVVDYVR
ncbi:MAG: hypothetical protein A2W23_02920 [Planctomycetes bacterium RBG_16_43_13]|nr:MAG: hypothetical protein A2W23_02920 [Planctomycetes bacterium RBG_16_43_13]